MNNTIFSSSQSSQAAFGDEVKSKSIIGEYLTFADRQKPNHLLWFSLSLMINGVLALAIPAILILNYNAPLAVLAITVVGFFSNLIANMGGSGIRTTITLFFLMLIINSGMLLFYIL